MTVSSFERTAWLLLCRQVRAAVRGDGAAADDLARAADHVARIAPPVPEADQLARTLCHQLRWAARAYGLDTPEDRAETGPCLKALEWRVWALIDPPEPEPVSRPVPPPEEVFEQLEKRGL